MIGEGIHEELLRALVEQNAIREARVSRIAGDETQWSFSVRVGGLNDPLISVHSRHEQLRTWTNLSEWTVCR